MFDQTAMKYIAASADDISATGKKYTHGLPSPCMSVCQMDAASGWCLGCLRTLPEIAAWGQADESSKRQIWSAIAARVRTRLVATDVLAATL
ncbi:MAG: DUF1289 domain-containing protein [Rhodoferax sp.]|nr:DUF1289 domain-containing protein [Rhodoferax sp.]